MGVSLSLSNYELTDRGKVMMTIILVLLLFIVPSAILVYAAMGNQTLQSPPDNQVSETVESPPHSNDANHTPVSAESPPPSGGGFNPTDDERSTGELDSPDVSPSVVSPVESSPDDPPDDPPEASPSDDPLDTSPPGAEEDSTTHPTVKPPDTGSTGGNPYEGSCTFFFSPSQQDRLDSETLSMLDEFLKSPRNTDNNMIVVEMPKLSDKDFEKTISIIVSAFASRGVSEQRLAYITIPGKAAGEEFLIRLYFAPQNTK